MNNMQKTILSVVAIAAFGGYAYFLRSQNNQIVAEGPTGSTPQTPTPTPTQTPTPVPTPAPATAPSGRYRDGTYTGASVDAYYGQVQVQAIIQSGAIADVKFLQYPNDRGTSLRISNQAMPILKREAIQAQSAKVDGISGATQTVDGFVKSLTDALSQART